jgi:hypothetical protein
MLGVATTVRASARSPSPEPKPASASVAKPRCKIAADRDELEGAFGLVYQAYLRSGLAEPNHQQMRITPWQLLPTSDVMVATLRGEVVCTMSLVADGELGLPMESIYSHEVDRFRYQGSRIAEVSCLADRRGKISRSLPVLIDIMSLTAQCARARGVDELLIAVHPHHATFYEKFVGFRRIGGTRSYAGVCDNPAVALAMDVNRWAIDHPRSFQRFFGNAYAEEALEPRPIPEWLLPAYAELVQRDADKYQDAALPMAV